MTSPLAQTLRQHLHRSLYSQGQLATLSGVPKNTITNWLSGRVSKPHQWHGLIRVATALRLTAEETDALLLAAGQPSLAELRLTTQAKPDERDLLTPWESLLPIPFQALPDLPYFIGRENELQTLRVQLLESKRVCLSGMGGVGKTTLAAHLAYSLRSHFSDGVLWVRLDTSDTLTILYTLAKSYGMDVRHTTTVDSRATLVRGLLASKRTLIILDNTENSAQIAPLLPPSTGACAVLVTTRFDLSITDGWPRQELHPFEPDTEDSLALFTRFLGSDPSPEIRPVLREMADLVGHLPLALAILGARLAQTPTSISHLLAHLRETYNRLDELEREQHSVRSTFDLSFTALPPDIQSFFIQLGAFGGEDFTPNAAAFVTQRQDQATNYLIRLRQLSLLKDSPEGRYRLHPLLRDYARERLCNTNHPTAPYARMIQYYIDWVKAFNQPGHIAQAISPASLLPDISNLIASLETAHQQGLEEYLPSALHTFFDTLYQQGFASVLAKHLESAIAYTQFHGKTAQQASMYNLLGQVHYWLGRDPHPLYQTALELARREEDEAVICDALRLLAGHAWRNNQFEKSKTKALEALKIARRLDYSARIVELLVNLGALAYVQKDFQQAEKDYREGLALARKIGYHRAQMVILQNLACLLADQGHYGKAVSYFQQGVLLGREHAFQDALTGLLGDWGYRALRHADLARAEACCLESLSLAREMGHSARIATRLSDLGEVARLNGDFKTALSYQEEAHKLAKEANLVPVTPLVALRFANLYADLGQFQQAEESLTQCLLERDALHDEFEGELRETQQRLRPPT